MSDWISEARDIPPWKCARLRWVGPEPLPPGVELWFGVADLSPDDLACCVVDLEHPDTLAAFNRRLALRLGAPDHMAADGVIMGPVDAGLVVHVGLGWTTRVVDVGGTRDPLLARVRAWRSAT